MVPDRDGRIVQFNQVCQRLSGYCAEEVEGRRRWDFLVLIEEASTVERSFREVLGGTPSQAQCHWVAGDGRRLLIE
jgi:PAS domain S-box-containing protein